MKMGKKWEDFLGKVWYNVIVGSEGSAAGGGRSDPNEWQRSARDEGEQPRTFAGNRNRTVGVER